MAKKLKLGLSKEYIVNGKKFKTKKKALEFAKKVKAKRIKVVTFDTVITSK